jgi:membrane-bound lytic murein transglycosylase B
VIRPITRTAIFLIAACALHSGLAADIHAKNKPKKAKKAAVMARKAPVAAPAPAQPLYATRPDALLAADNIAQSRGLDAAWVRQVMGQAQFVPFIVRAMTPAPKGTPKNWATYRSRVIEPIRIRAGVRFWQNNRETLERAERETGVPAAIIVGIVGVETIYGQNVGNFRVIDALSTLAFDFPQAHPRAKERSAFFRSELGAFLSLAQRNGLDPLRLRGSYAGAMGLPQFMPSSWSNYAVDFDGDGRIDLFQSTADVIGSVANYFKAHRWQPGIPTHYPVNLFAQGQDKADLLAPDILPSFTPAAFMAKGAIVDEAAQRHPGLLALVELQNGGAEPLYIAGTENFYAITRYNWSSYYALSVIELGQEVTAAMPK